MTPTQRIAQARKIVLSASKNAAFQEGEAQWTNGYRAGAKLSRLDDTPLYEKEMKQWGRVGDAQASVSRALARYARAIRAEKGK